jgi:hypothetical protein
MYTKIPNTAIVANSDFHFFHKNILKYEFEPRSILLKNVPVLKDYTSGDTVADYLAKLTDNDRFLAFDQI